MSVVSVKVRSQESGVNKNELTVTEVYIVVVDGETDNSETARVACPGVGTYFGTTAARCISSTSAMVDGDPTAYLVTVQYSNAFDPTQAEPNPLSRPAKFSYNGNNTSAKFFRDRSPQPQNWTGFGTDGFGLPDPDADPPEVAKPWLGKPLVTSAGEQFSDLPERFETQGSITITRNETGYDDSVAETWRDTVNLDDVILNSVTYTAGQLLMSNISAEGPLMESFTDGFGIVTTVTFWSVTYTVNKAANKFDLPLEDRGFSQLTGDEGDDDRKLTPIMDRAGVPVALPFPLDGKGKARVNPTDIPAVLTFKPYRERTWANHSFV